ncbi:glycosyltransferase [Acidomonas methanolica]|uniref:Glycosyl transferase n=1 Tax=Acidomonas methanolica NBRC 104435 TaxID=1231351 RepID=A0A023D472_ACIMT|nr:glycosyltransferase [Acidomonas methanolica]MBU2654290.1 glycosyltransferase [Acidomonas methanolica]TCS29271.1 hopene-associated glycosyltransferase HpnB [Acidomonas methanolica]GAJ28932.1 glycosyl transferase [Acidomonas methanolica NBRC 104435]GBQ52777.1 glycosyltransferase [Acidomonas methanolica]GEK99293.1 glycosyl transferase [Acidomonas methanolica NBRC 104435]
MWRDLLGLAALGAWLKLVFAHGRFWRYGPVLTPAGALARSPEVAIVVPARDEAETIAACVESLLGQDYDGPVSVFVVDDRSGDGTGAIARAVPDPRARLTVIEGRDRPAGWSGKLWAVHQGVQAALERLGADAFILLTDADIIHDPAHLRTLVGKAQAERLDLVSEMVRLKCESAAERALVPAFVYFFAMLYPFARINDPASPVAGAAGGTMLVRRMALERIGGIEALRGALIDDCTLAAHVKRTGGALYLGHSELAWSKRPYEGAGDIWRMIARTAYVQLRYSPLLLLGTVLGLALVWFAPMGLALFGRGRARLFGALAWGLSMASFAPTLRRFGQPFWRALPLPLVAGFYMAATIGSAVDHHRGKGVRWKDRAYTEPVHGGGMQA